MAVQNIRGRRPTVQGSDPRVSGLVRVIRDAVAERERRRVLGVPLWCLRER